MLSEFLVSVHLMCDENRFKMHSKCIHNIFKMYSKCNRNVLGMYSKCNRNAIEMYSKCIQNALVLHSECISKRILNALEMFLVYSNDAINIDACKLQSLENFGSIVMLLTYDRNDLNMPSRSIQNVLQMYSKCDRMHSMWIGITR